jgi:hypothetical protein
MAVTPGAAHKSASSPPRLTSLAVARGLTGGYISSMGSGHKDAIAGGRGIQVELCFRNWIRTAKLAGITRIPVRQVYGA